MEELDRRRGGANRRGSNRCLIAALGVEAGEPSQFGRWSRKYGGAVRTS